MNPRISVIITAHNYGKYISKAVDSVLNQTYQDFELIVVNDGSTDNTQQILERYMKKHADKMRILNTNKIGLAAACNSGIKESTGEYVIRLDADDYFDENILLVELNFLEKHPDIGLVYPDYYEINIFDEILNHKKLLRVNDEVKLLDRDPLAAGAMYRRDCYEKVGRYNEKLRYQEDFDFWIKFVSKFKVFNINLPLYYYRQHPLSMSTNFNGRMNARRMVKKEFVNKNLMPVLKKLKILAVVPIRENEEIATRNLEGKPLIYYTLREALKTKLIDKVVVSTGKSKKIKSIAKKMGADFIERPAELSKQGVPIESPLIYTLKQLKKKKGYSPDIIAMLPILSPNRTEKHITEAINTLLIFNVDSVISVCEEKKFHWKPGMHGLKPLFEKRLLKHEKETLYRENGAVYVTKKSTLEKFNQVIGKSVGNILMSEKESLHIDSKYHFWLAEQIKKSEKQKQNIKKP